MVIIKARFQNAVKTDQNGFNLNLIHLKEEKRCDARKKVLQCINRHRCKKHTTQIKKKKNVQDTLHLL